MRFKHLKINDSLTVTSLITEKQFGKSKSNVPVGEVSWNEATEFATKHGYRLITSDEYDLMVAELPELLFSCMYEWTATDRGSYRVFRGGKWSYAPRIVRSAYQDYYDPGNRHYDLGFRMALVQKETK